MAFRLAVTELFAALTVAEVKGAFRKQNSQIDLDQADVDALKLQSLTMTVFSAKVQAKLVSAPLWSAKPIAL